MEMTVKSRFDLAEMYYHSANLISREIVGRENLVNGKSKYFSLLPALYALDALSIELYLKCILGIEKGIEVVKKLKKHHLHYLFSLLSQGAKESIEAYYNQLIADDRQVTMVKQQLNKHIAENYFGLLNCLQEMDNAFVEWRYSDEFERKGFPTGQIIINACRKYIFKLKPEFIGSYPEYSCSDMIQPIIGVFKEN